MPLERFTVPFGAPPVVVSAVPYGPGDHVHADPSDVEHLVSSGGLVSDPEPARPATTKAAKKPQEDDA